MAVSAYLYSFITVCFVTCESGNIICDIPAICSFKSYTTTPTQEPNPEVLITSGDFAIFKSAIPTFITFLFFVIIFYYLFNVYIIIYFFIFNFILYYFFSLFHYI